MNCPEKILEFDKIKELLCGYALSESAQERLRKLAPLLSERDCAAKTAETTDARQLLDSVGSPPLSAMKEIGKTLILCEKGSMLSPEQLEAVSVFLSSCKRTIAYLKKAEATQSAIACYGATLSPLATLQTEIDRSIQNGMVVSAASNTLRDIRRKIESEGAQIKKKLDELLRSKKNLFSDGYVSMRNGRYVVPVKKEFKNQVSGSVIDVSGTGGTYFIEPTVVNKLQDTINTLKLEEENETRRILYTLTALVDEHDSELRRNMEAMETLDVAFAKAKLSADMKAIAVTVSTQRSITIKQGRHPLLRREDCVPLDFSVGGAHSGVVITGPNTGGKTVALKTVGLLSMMAQSGLHVPVECGSFRMNNLYLCDIGDGQSIAENLSTFSAHITNIIDILRRVNEDSLVLLDELGSGTDPAEGMGIAVAILEELRAKNCLFLATTHYPEVKEFAAATDGLRNARMAFDRESLKPLYRLELGEAGESCALYIAKRLGFPTHMLARAQRAAYSTAPRVAQEQADLLTVDGEEPCLLTAIAPPRIQKAPPVPVENSRSHSFHIGDSVLVSPENTLGLVFQTVDASGQIGVQIQGKKLLVSYKRLTLKTAASELYPADYDFSIVFDSVENRKARHQMGKKHVPGLAVRLDEIGS